MPRPASGRLKRDLYELPFTKIQLEQEIAELEEELGDKRRDLERVNKLLAQKEKEK